MTVPSYLAKESTRDRLTSRRRHIIITTPSPKAEAGSAKASLAEVADALGCSTKTVRRYIADGRLTGYRMGPRLIRVDMAEVAAMLSPIPTVQAS